VKCLISICAILALLFGVRRASADIILYTTFGPGSGPGQAYVDTAYGVNGSNSVSNIYEAIAAPFMPTSTGILTSVTVPLLPGNDGPANVILASANGSGGGPGTILENLGSISTNDFNPGPVVYTINSSIKPTLTAGTSYWVELVPSNQMASVGWCWADSQFIGNIDFLASPTGSWTQDANMKPIEAFQINGVAVPEPSSFVLLGLAAIVVFCCWRLTQRKKWRVLNNPQA
jgi:PEP-CTERM motif